MNAAEQGIMGSIIAKLSHKKLASVMLQTLQYFEIFHFLYLQLGSDTNIPKFGLNIFREILENALNISKNSLNISKNFLIISKYPENSEILIRWRIFVSKPQCRQRLSRHSNWRMQCHANACVGKKLIIDAKSLTHW